MAIDLYEVVTLLVGRIQPVGETREDERRLENLKEMCDLVERLVADIVRVELDNNNAHQASMKKASNVARSCLEGLGVMGER